MNSAGLAAPCPGRENATEATVSPVVVLPALLHGILPRQESVGQTASQARRWRRAAAALGSAGAVHAHARVSLTQIGRLAPGRRSLRGRCRRLCLGRRRRRGWSGSGRRGCLLLDVCRRNPGLFLGILGQPPSCKQVSWVGLQLADRETCRCFPFAQFPESLPRGWLARSPFGRQSRRAPWP